MEVCCLVWLVAREGSGFSRRGFAKGRLFRSVLWPGLGRQYVACSWLGVRRAAAAMGHSGRPYQGQATQATADQVLENATVNFRVRRASVMVLSVASRACLAVSV